MPSTYAHRRFGANVADHLPADTRALISRHRELYDIGLHGPDIFFYYHALKSNPVARFGNQMHDEPGEKFFAEARRRIPQMASPEAALVYTLGFICHFALDSTCHPYIEKYVRESGVSHSEIETEFDNQLMRRDGLDPFAYFTASHIHPTQENAAVIAPFFDEVSLEETYESLRGMIKVHKALQVTSPAKRWLLLTAMRAAGKYDSLHGLVANAQPNPKCAASGKRLDELYAQALPLAEQLILEFIDAQTSDAPLNIAYQHTFGEF